LELLGGEVKLLVEVDELELELELELERLLLEEDELLDDDKLEGDGVSVGVGVGVGCALDDAAAAGLESAESESPALKTVMYPIAPFGTVTTQKLPPPAPVADSGLVTSLTLLTEGSIEQGKPLQAPSGSQVILMPQLGAVLAKSEASQMGLYPIFTNVSPLATWFAPET
jgi:hypothetical protein